MPKKTSSTAKPVDPLHLSASWYSASAALLAAAKTLWPKARTPFRRKGSLDKHSFRTFTQHAPAFLLLSAFAVENALKGTRVKQIRRARGIPTVARPKRNAGGPNYVWGHDLPALARSIGLQTDNADDELLNTLKRNIEWAGRYPGPSGVGEGFVPRHGSQDLRRITSLIRRIKRL